MPYDLKNRRVLVTGGSRGLGAEISRKFAAAGAHVVVNYASSPEPAEALVSELTSSYPIKATALQADCGDPAAIAELIRASTAFLGGLDIVISNAGWTKSTPNPSDLHALSYDDWDRCWRVNVTGMHCLFREAAPHLTKNPEGGVFVFTASVAATSLGGSSMAYSVSKAAQVHLMKWLAQTQGPKVRINAVLPGLLLTEWGLGFGEERINATKNRAVLKKETEIGDCADAYLMLARNTSMAGQTIQVDSGLNVANM